jgi:hypothetical protein
LCAGGALERLSSNGSRAGLLGLPSSYHTQISLVMDIAIRLQPATVFDVGVGYGKYGTLLREYLGDDALIEGIEAWGAYANTRPDGASPQSRWWAYHRVINGSWPDGLQSDDRPTESGCRYDLGLMIDVIEHYDQPDGYVALDRLLDVCDYAIVATPHDPLRQDHLPNPWERHKSRWNVQHFAGGRYHIAEAHHLPTSLVVLLSKHSSVDESRR